MREFIKKNWAKVSGGFLASVVAINLLALPAFAEGEATTAVTTAFTGLKDDIIVVLGAVAALGVSVMAVFLGWKYGRKIFSTVAH